MAHFRAATLWPLSSVFYALSLSTVVVLGAFFGPRWGMSIGQVVAFLFLADVFLHVFTDLPEVYSETQNSIAAWRKILAVHDMPVEIVEPAEGVELPRGALSVEAKDIHFTYREGPEVLHGISLSVPAGGHVAIVGETGCGKSTFAKVVSRLADPTEGALLIDGGDPRQGAPGARPAPHPAGPPDAVPFRTTRPP